MNETYVTLRGWLGADVRHRLAGDTPVAEFRLGVTPRWFDTKRSEWVDATTQWYTVKAWRQLADNCRDSLRRLKMSMSSLARDTAQGARSMAGRSGGASSAK